MLGHFIQHKGKGALVIALPLLMGIILFTIADFTRLDENYIGPISFLSSAFIIWFYDGGPALLRDGFRNVKKSRHTLYWIEVKYWALIMGITGCIWLSVVMTKK